MCKKHYFYPSVAHHGNSWHIQGSSLTSNSITATLDIVAAHFKWTCNAIIHIICE